jgi:hypothetical protein
MQGGKGTDHAAVPDKRGTWRARCCRRAQRSGWLLAGLLPASVCASRLGWLLHSLEQARSLPSSHCCCGQNLRTYPPPSLARGGRRALVRASDQGCKQTCTARRMLHRTCFVADNTCFHLLTQMTGKLPSKPRVQGQKSQPVRKRSSFFQGIICLI